MTLIVLLFAMLHGAVGSTLQAGVATWYDDGSGMYGATPEYGGDPYTVRVCAGEKCVTVLVRDYCACGDRNGRATLIDLSPSAFGQLAPLSRGVIAVTVERSDIKLPPTDTE